MLHQHRQNVRKVSGVMQRKSAEKVKDHAARVRRQKRKKEGEDVKMKAIKVSPENASVTNNGRFQGWGTSLIWWANRMGYSDKLAQDAAELFFSEKGIGYNIMRYNIGGGDDPTHHHITRTDSMIPGWMKWDEESKAYVYDYEADRNQLNVLKKAIEAAGEDAYVEVFSNSPPYFMCVSGCSSGGVDPSVNNLKDECYDDFAEYMAHVSEYMQKEMGIKVSSVAAMNEPNTPYWRAFSDKQEGCHFDAGEAQDKILQAIAKAFAAKGMEDVEVTGSDETSTNLALLAYQSYSEETKKIVNRISSHSYGEEKMAELGALMKEEGRNIWMSEVDGGHVAGEDAGEMGAALWLGKKIIRDMNGLSPSGWVIWLTIDHHISKDGYMGNKDNGMPDLDGGYWGLAVADHDRQEIILTQKYYAMGQFSRYIRPGDTIIHCDEDVLAAYNKETGKVVVVAVNDTAQEKEYQIELADFEKTGASVRVIRTSGNSSDGEKWAELEPAAVCGNCLEAKLKANSITTYIIE